MSVSVCVCIRVPVCVVARPHHQGLGQDVLHELEVAPLQLLALGPRALRLLVGIETEELRLVLELALLQN